MSGLLIAVGLVVLIAAHELGHFLAAKAFRLHVHEFGLGFPPKLWGRKRGDTEYTVNALPLGGFVRIAGEEDEGDEAGVPREKLLSAQKWHVRAAVVVAGVAVNALIAWILLTAVLASGTPRALVIADVEPGSPAAASGLMAGDVVTDYDTAQELADAARYAAGNSMILTISREGKERQYTVTPRVPSESQPGALGVGLTEAGIDRVPLWRAPWEGARAAWGLTYATVAGFVTMVVTLFGGTVPQDVVGPVGIVSTASQVGAIGAIYLIQMLAVISINLAVLNMLPIPALDGGRFYLILAEAVTGKKLPKWIEIRANAVTFIALIALMLLLTARDVLRLF